MKIAIRVDASGQIGAGHFMRCLALADALKHISRKIFFLSRCLPEYLQTLLEEKGHAFVNLIGNSDDYKNLDRLDHSHWLTVSQKQDAIESIQALSSWSEKSSAWDWLVVDHYALDSRWETELRQIVKKVLVIDDLADRKHDCDVLLDQNYYENMHNRYNQKVPSFCEMLLGPKYALLRDEFNKIHTEARPRVGKPKRLLVFFGGFDNNNYTMRRIEVLSRIGTFGLRVDVIVGEKHPDKIAIESKCNTHGFTCHVQTNRMAEIIANSDVAIGTGGVVTWERICCLLPAIVITTAENQVLPMKELAKLRLICYLGHEWQGVASKINAVVRDVISGKFNDKYIIDNKVIEVDGLGVERVVSSMYGINKWIKQ